MNKSFWVSSNKMTVAVDIDGKEMITDAPPIVRKFIVQSLDNLVRWMNAIAKGGVTVTPLGPWQDGDPVYTTTRFGGTVLAGHVVESPKEKT